MGFFQSATPCDTWIIVLCIFGNQCQGAAIVSNASSSNGQGKRRENERKKKKKPVKKEKRPVGRPKGSKNKKSEKPTLSPELLRIQPVLAGIFGGFERRFGGAVSGDGWSLWKLPKRLDGLTNWTAIRFKTSL